MKPRWASSTLLLFTLIMFISFLALTCAPYKYSQLSGIPRVTVDGVIASSVFPVLHFGSQDQSSSLLNQSTRLMIYSFVRDNPGLHFRALSNSLDLPVGVLQYHLGLLVDKGLLSSYLDGRYKRFFESGKFSETAMKVISLLRNGTSGKIVAALFHKPQTSHKELAAQMGISSQALSWQMHRLRKAGLVAKTLDGLTVKYSLSKPVYTTISRYSFITEKLMP